MSARALCSSLAVSLLLMASSPSAAAPALPFTPAEQKAELGEKLSRVQRWLNQQKLGGLLLGQIRNISWITAGRGPQPIVITSEAAPYSLLLLRNGKRFALASSIESQRVQDEELKGLGYQPRSFPWHTDRQLALVKELAGSEPVASDLPVGDLRPVDLTPLRSPLTATEIKKYRWLGQHTTEAVIEVVKQLKPGLTEKQMEALTSDALLRRQIQPTVLLMGTDQRLFKYRHATPAAGILRQYGMVNVCARRWGLVIAVTRFAHFGKLPAALEKRLQAAARVNAELLAAARPGTSADALLKRAQAAYASQGFPGQWEKHHQGGTIGYAERDWMLRPGGQEQIQVDQAVAFNPTIEGAKIEDTLLITRQGVINLTERPGWPTISHTIDGITINSPAILVR